MYGCEMARRSSSTSSVWAGVFTGITPVFELFLIVFEWYWYWYLKSDIFEILIVFGRGCFDFCPRNGATAHRLALSTGPRPRGQVLLFSPAEVMIVHTSIQHSEAATRYFSRKHQKMACTEADDGFVRLVSRSSRHMPSCTLSLELAAVATVPATCKQLRSVAGLTAPAGRSASQISSFGSAAATRHAAARARRFR